MICDHTRGELKRAIVYELGVFTCLICGEMVRVGPRKKLRVLERQARKAVATLRLQGVGRDTIAHVANNCWMNARSLDAQFILATMELVAKGEM